MSDRVVKDLLLPDRGNSVALDINWLSFSPSVAALMPGLLRVLIWEQRSLQKAVTWFGSSALHGGSRGERPRKTNSAHKLDGSLSVSAGGKQTQ